MFYVIFAADTKREKSICILLKRVVYLNLFSFSGTMSFLNVT